MSAEKIMARVGVETRKQNDLRVGRERLVGCDLPSRIRFLLVKGLMFEKITKMCYNQTLMGTWSLFYFYFFYFFYHLMSNLKHLSILNVCNKCQ